MTEVCRVLARSAKSHHHPWEERGKGIPKGELPDPLRVLWRDQDRRVRFSVQPKWGDQIHWDPRSKGFWSGRMA